MAIMIWTPLSCPPVPPPVVPPPDNSVSPVLAAVPNQVGNVGIPVSLQLAATDKIIYEAAPLPAGLSLDANGLISGSPTAAGVQQVAAKATNQSGKSDTKNFQFTVNAAVPVLIDTTGLTSAGTVVTSANAVVIRAQAAQRTVSRVNLFLAQGGGNTSVDCALRLLGGSGTVTTSTTGALPLSPSVTLMTWDFPNAIIEPNVEMQVIINTATLLDITTPASPLIGISQNPNISPRVIINGTTP